MICHTPRLQLRYLQERDIPLLHSTVFSDMQVMQHAFGGSPLSLAQTEVFCGHHAAKEGEKTGLGALYLSQEDTLIGFAGLLPHTALGEGACELGFVLSVAHWGRGYATEIGRAQIALAGSLGRQEVFAMVRIENAASKAVLQRLEMQYIRCISTQDRGERELYRRETERHL